MLNKAIVIWLTGMSGVGKSTLSNLLVDRIKKKGLSTLILDGDYVRKHFHSHLSFTQEDILENNRLVAELCVKNLSNYDLILVPIISPFAKGRRRAREIIGKSYFEIYVKASTPELVRRDTKGLYKKALKGEIDNLIGFSRKIPYEEPKNPDMILETDNFTPEENIEALTKKLYGWTKQHI